MFLFILLGCLFLVASGVALVSDVMRAIDAGQFVLTPLGKTWFDLDSSSLNFSQAIVQRYIIPEIWDPGVITVLNWPTVYVAAGAGVFLLLVAGTLRTGKRNRK